MTRSQLCDVKDWVVESCNSNYRAYIFFFKDTGMDVMMICGEGRYNNSKPLAEQT
jgi:hypothetical protein